MPDSAAVTHSDIFWAERNDTKVNAREAIKSRLLIGVTGFGWFSRGRDRFFAPGTGWLQM
jgi:hypothetical protein